MKYKRLWRRKRNRKTTQNGKTHNWNLKKGLVGEESEWKTIKRNAHNKT